MTTLYLVHGFLGSGKTSLLWEMAKRLLGRGKHVGLITNDQVPDLVDTAFLTRTGATVAEVHGSCFCCNFMGFVSAINEIRKRIEPDAIFAEPVGSCADLAATVARPLERQFAGVIRVAPITVVVDAQRFERILCKSPTALQSGAAYIFSKQIEEGDILAVNKTDLIEPDFLNELSGHLQKLNSTATIVPMSVKNGKNVDAWWDLVNKVSGLEPRVLDIDYELYGTGEQELGWLNAVIDWEGSADWNAFARDVLRNLQQAFQREGMGVGHAKFLLESPRDYIVGNLTDTTGRFEIRGIIGPCDKVKMTLNVRVAAAPAHVESLVRGTLAGFVNQKVTMKEQTWQCIQPSAPKPTYRANA